MEMLCLLIAYSYYSPNNPRIFYSQNVVNAVSSKQPFSIPSRREPKTITWELNEDIRSILTPKTPTLLRVNPVTFVKFVAYNFIT